MSNLKDSIIPLVEQRIAHTLSQIEDAGFNRLEEIRLRAGKPIMVQNCHGDWCIKSDGKLTKGAEDAIKITEEQVRKSFELISAHSIYAFQEEIKNGFLTLKGGHRVGISGRAVLDAGLVKNIKDISSLNIRIAKEILGASDKIINYIINDEEEVLNTLIVSPPGSGKTTILRDIARTISSGTTGFKGAKVTIVDERSEIAACHKGVPQNSVGLRTDVLDACPKRHGMIMALRSLSPHVIITDEIGNSGDKDAIMQVINAGAKIITTAHGYNLTELKARREILELLDESVFDRYIVLSSAKGPGTIVEVLDKRGAKIYVAS